MIKKLFLIWIWGSMLSSLNACAKSNGVDNELGNKLIWQHSLNELFSDRGLRTLANAAGEGKLDEVNNLIKSGVDPNATGTLGATPVLWPLLKWNYSGFEALVDAGAEVDVVYDDDYGCLISFVAFHEDSRFLKLILDRGADPNQRCGLFNKTALYSTLSESKSDRLKRKYLYAAGADINVTAAGYLFHIIEGDVTTPLLSALGQGHYKTALELLDLGADPNLKLNDGRYHVEEHIKISDKTLLHSTEKRRDFEAVKKWLIENDIYEGRI